MSSSTLARYSGPAPAFMQGPRGACVDPATLKAMTATFAVSPRLITVAPGVHNLVGIGISSRLMVEAPEGLIVFDTGDDLEDGERALAEFRKISSAPIKAIVYSHNHYAHGAQAFLKDSPEAIVIGHHEINHHLADIASGFSTGGEFPEAVPALTARYERQFALNLPPSGPDTGLAAVIAAHKPRGTALATHLVTDGQEMVVAGLRMQFFTAHFSDSEDTLTAWMPDLRLVYNNFFWPGLFNFYTLRGDVFRDPRAWRDGLRKIRALEPELLVNTHALPVTGQAEVRRSLELYMDAISFLIDQSVRGINKGLGPEQLKEFVRLPPHLRDFANNSESYSEFFYFPPYLYQHVLGWFDGDAASIHRMQPDEEGRRIVAGFGGPQRVLDMHAKAMAENDLIWASRLGGWLLAVDAEDDRHRQAQADALRQIAYRSPGTIPRHFCLTKVMELERKIKPIHAVLPGVQAITAAAPGRFIDHQRIRLVPERALDVQQTLAFEISDKGARVALEVRRGVCDYVAEPAAGGLTLRLDHATWAAIYIGELTPAQALEQGRAQASDAQAVLAFFALFDTPAEACGA